MFQRHFRNFIVLTLVTCASATWAGVPNLINYQGQLTNLSGTPVPDGPYSIRFRIWDAATGGNILWDNGTRGVLVTGGLFSYMLGDSTAFPASLFDGSADRWLGLQVGNDLEMMPRSRLASTPSAIQAAKVRGDLETGTGRMILKTATGDSAMVFESTEGDLGSFVGIKMFDPQPEPPGKMCEMMADPSVGSCIRMFDPQPEPPGKLFEILANPTNGARMSFLDQAGEVMGVEPSPFGGGFSMKFLDPQSASPMKMMELNTQYGASKSASLTMTMPVVTGAGKSPESADLTLVNLKATSRLGELRLGPGAQSGGTMKLVSGSANDLESRIEVIGPPGPLASHPVVLSSTASDARVGIGVSTPSQALHVSGNICYTGSIGACSDGRYKKDVRTIDNPLETLQKVRGVRYAWKQTEYPGMNFDDQQHLGFIAQELKDLLPGVVLADSQGYMSVDYSRLTPLLVEAVKQLKAENDALRIRTDRIAGLEAQLASLKATLEGLAGSK